MSWWRQAISEQGSARSWQARVFSWLLVLALVLKACYLAEYLELPFLFGPLFDSQVYLLQARRIGEARFGDPALLAFSPLYGYFLALLGAHQGSIQPVLAQLALGLANLWLIRQIGVRVFGELAGLAAAVLYLGYGPLLFFETKIMSETLGLFLLLLTLALIYRSSFARGEPRVCAAAGVSMALAVLTRASLLPAIPLLAASLWIARPDEPSDRAASLPLLRRARVRRPLWFALALGLVLCAHGGWTRLHSGLFVPVILVSNTAARATQQTWTGDLNVFRAVQEESVGAFSVVAQARQRLARLRRGEPEPVAEPFSLGGYVVQIPSKLWLTLRDSETSFDYGYYGERTEVSALRVPVVSFALLLALGALGLLGALSNRKLGALAPLLAVALGTLLTTTLFHPSTRYRLPLVVLLLPLSGYALQLAWQQTEPRRRTLALGLLGALCLVCAIVQGVRPLEHPALWDLRVAESLLEEGDFASARTRLQQARTRAPNDAQVAQRVLRLSRRLPVPAVN